MLVMGWTVHQCSLLQLLEETMSLNFWQRKVRKEGNVLFNDAPNTFYFTPRLV